MSPPTGADELRRGRYDLVALDLAWKTDVQTLPTFVALEREIKAKFRTL